MWKASCREIRLLSEGFDKALIISTKGWDKRSISEPQTESVVRGPREGFTENFRTNTALLRRRIKSPNLRMDHLTIGEKTDTNVCVAYIEGVADPGIVETVKARLKSISADAILDTGYIEQYIEDHPFSMFPTIGYSEKPDVVTARILEGRVAIIADGSPFVLTAPCFLLKAFNPRGLLYTSVLCQYDTYPEISCILYIDFRPRYSLR